MTLPPAAPLLLGLAGLIPFLWAAATGLSPALGGWSAGTFGPLFTGDYLGLTYGTVILSFMSGVLWGFATRLEGAAAATGYALSVVPALWAFFMVNGAPDAAAVNLIAGFSGLLLLDWHFVRLGAAPPWWMTLRLVLTLVVIACLAVAALR